MFGVVLGKEYAAIKFFLYTLVGGVMMLIAVLMLYFTSDLRGLNEQQLVAASVVSAEDSAASAGGNREFRDAGAHVQHHGPATDRAIHRSVYGRPRLPVGTLVVVVGVLAAVYRLCHQGAERAGAYLAAGRPRRGADADLDAAGPASC